MERLYEAVWNFWNTPKARPSPPDLGVDPDVNKPQGEYCLVTSDLWLFFHGGYYDCLEYLSWIRGVQLEMMTLAAYNQALDAAGYEPFKFDRK